MASCPFPRDLKARTLYTGWFETFKSSNTADAEAMVARDFLFKILTLEQSPLVVTDGFPSGLPMPRARVLADILTKYAQEGEWFELGPRFF